MGEMSEVSVDMVQTVHYQFCLPLSWFILQALPSPIFYIFFVNQYRPNLLLNGDFNLSGFYVSSKPLMSDPII